MRKAQAKLGTGDSSTHRAALGGDRNSSTGSTQCLHCPASPCSPSVLEDTASSAGIKPQGPGFKLWECGIPFPTGGWEMGSCLDLQLEGLIPASREAAEGPDGHKGNSSRCSATGY